MLFKTTRVKFTLIFTIFITAILVAFSLFLFSFYKNELLQGQDKQLVDTAKSLSPEQISPNVLDPNTQIIRRVGTEYYLLANHNGEVSISSINLRDKQQWPLNAGMIMAAFKGMPRYETVKYKGENYRTLYYPLNEDNILHIGSPLENSDRGPALIRKLFLMFSPSLIALLAFAGWFVSGSMLAPLVVMKSAADDIRNGKSTEKRIRLGSKGKEIDDLVLMFNDMLDGAQRSLEAQKRFTSDVSHEIRSPLTSLRGNIEVTLRKKRSPEEYEELLRNNLADIIRISRISDNLLLLARADNNILEIRRQWFDIGILLERVVEQLRFKADRAGLSVTGEYAECLEVSGDVELIEQAFTNIVDNAIKYSGKGGDIKITARKQGGFATVLFKDTGIGIAEKDLPHIFERFYRADKAHSRKLGGTGLGLAITQWIIQAHEGRVEVRSVEGSGTDFLVRLPAKQA